MTADTNTNALLERLRQRVDPSEYDRGYCASCEAQLTVADVENGTCTNCGATIVDRDSADEHLWTEADEEYDLGDPEEDY